MALDRSGFHLSGLFSDVVPSWDPNPWPLPKHTELNAGLETSEQESGILVAEFLNFLWRECVSSEPDFQNGVILFKGPQEGLCPKGGDVVVRQLQDFQT